MKTNVNNASTNFEPLLDFLSIEGASSDEIAKVFDELLYDYAHLNFVVQQADLDPKDLIHEEADKMLYWIKSMRDAVGKCSFNFNVGAVYEETAA